MARDQGLDPANYSVAELEALAADGRGNGNDERFAELLDRSFNMFVLDAAFGRLNPAAADPDWHIPPPDRPNEPLALVAAADAGRFGPPHRAYARLQEAMTRYVAAQSAGGWQQMPAGPILHVGMRHEQVELARNRLRFTGDFEGDTQADAWFFGAGLDRAVRRFQARHALNVDGVIGDSTREVMNVAVETRLRQLAIAMERWRWLPADLGDQYVWVNAAQLMMQVVNHDEVVLSTRTIVGHSTRPTPSLQSEIRALVFNPTWSVPDTIAREDLLPKVQRDPGFLARNGFQVYRGWGENSREVDPATVNWTALNATHLPYRFVQASGARNSLGLVKVVFNNDYDIYLHDTPSKGLFSLRTRTFSSGCVRLEQANEFANYLLANHREPNDTNAAQWLQSPATQPVALQRRVPIYLTYITVWVDDDGRVNFRPDLYRRDAAVAAAMRNERARRLAGTK